MKSRWLKRVGISFILLLVAATLVWALSGTSDEYITGKWTFKVTPKFEDIQASNSTGLVGIVSGVLTMLTPGSSGQVIESNGTVHAFAAKNTFRQAAIHNFATLAASWTLSADEQLCLMLAATNANAACTIQATATAGKVFFLRNGSGQNVTLHSGSGTGITLATGTAAALIYDGILGDWVKLGTQVAQ